MEQLLRLFKTEPSLRQLFRYVLKEGKKPPKAMLASIKRLLQDPALREDIISSLSVICSSNGVTKKTRSRDTTADAKEESYASDASYPEARQLSAYFRDIKQFPLLKRGETKALFQELEQRRGVLRNIIASHASGIAEIITRGKAVIADEEPVQYFTAVPFSTNKELEKWRGAVEKMLERLNCLENQTAIHGRMRYVEEFVSLLFSLSLEPAIEDFALQAVETSLSRQNEPDSTDQNNLLILRRERARLKEVRDKVVLSNLRLVAKVAYTYKNLYPLSDLMQEGAIGLMRAAEKYDWRRGYLFSTYSVWWVQQAIQRAVANKKSVIRVPVHVQEKRKKLLRSENALVQLLGRNPTDQETAQFTGFTVNEIETLRKTMMPDPISLNEPDGEKKETELGDLIADENAINPEDAAAKDRLNAVMDRFLHMLTPREEKILRMRFAIDEKRDYTLGEVGAEFAVTRERVRQQEEKALVKLRGFIEQAGIREDLVDLSGKQREPFAKFCENIRQLKRNLEIQDTPQATMVHKILAEVADRHEISLQDLFSGKTKEHPLLEARREAMVILHTIGGCSVMQIASIFNLPLSHIEKALNMFRLFSKVKETISFS